MNSRATAIESLDMVRVNSMVTNEPLSLCSLFPLSVQLYLGSYTVEVINHLQLSEKALLWCSVSLVGAYCGDS